MKNPWLLLSIFLFSHFPIGIGSKMVTNPLRDDGFGGQYQTIIYSIVYAELTHKTFAYSPFRAMDHNYDKDPDFLQKKEWLINLMDYFPINRDHALQTRITPKQFIDYFESHLHECANSQALKRIRELFRLNKNQRDYYDDDHFHIAVHIRRHNPHDNRIQGTDSPDHIYLQTINELRGKYLSKNPLIHIFSQGDAANFKQTFQGEDIIFHLNEPVETTFPALVFANALVTSTSSFSYSAGILSEGEVYYIPFWHPPLPHWKIIGN